MSLRLDNHRLERIYRHGTSGNASAMRWSSALMTGGLVFTGLFKLAAGQDLLLLLVASVLLGTLVFWLSGPNDPLRKGDPFAEFQRGGLHLRMHCDNQPIWQKKLPRSRIASVAPYHQQGWLFGRDRGVVIEDSDGQQWRLVLRLSREELEIFTQTLKDSLEPLGYSLVKLRRFQP